MFIDCHHLDLQDIKRIVSLGLHFSIQFWGGRIPHAILREESKIRKYKSSHIEGVASERDTSPGHVEVKRSGQMILLGGNHGYNSNSP